MQSPDPDSQKPKTVRHTLQPNEPSLQSSFTSLKSWIEDSLDLFRNDLLNLLYPLFLHTFFDLVAISSDEANEFFQMHSTDFPHKRDELNQLSSIRDPLHIRENTLAYSLRTNKYYLPLSKYAFDLFINFIEEQSLHYILKTVNQYIDIKVTLTPNTTLPGLLNHPISNTPLTLNTYLVSKETEEAILQDEQYKYDHLETFVTQLKKQRSEQTPLDTDKSLSIPTHNTPSNISSEIEKLKDLTKRVTVSKNTLPSICCYTLHNTYDQLTCSEISDNTQLIACGYQSGVIEIFSVNGTLYKLKSSSELETSDIREVIPKQKNSPTSTPVTENNSNMNNLYTSLGNKNKLIGHTGPVFGTKFFSTNKYLVSCSQDCTVRLWSLEMWICVGRYKCHSFPLWCVDVSNDNFYWCSGSADRCVSVWNIKGVVRLLVGALSDVLYVKYHPNGMYIFTGSSDQKIRMYDVLEGSIVRTYNGHKDSVTCLSVSHCGRYLLSGCKDGSVILWDINTCSIINEYLGHEKAVYSVGFCYFGNLLVSSAGDNSVRLWDKADKVCLGTYFTKGTPIYCVKFGYRNIISCVGPFTG
ncbi:Transcription initiation factor TFIID subunit 5 [Hamiltosporidium tvaerminnensis]|nr:Transcription initiation factor TFIID subunit 5 [Hamiltosporidium tvaerminnensis]